MMKTELLIDMLLIDSDAVDCAFEYLLETVDEMRDEDLTLEEALLALGRVAAIVAEKISAKGVIH